MWPTACSRELNTGSGAYYTSEADHLHGLATNGFMVIHTITIHQAKLKHKKETVRKTEEIHWEQTVPKKTHEWHSGVCVRVRHRKVGGCPREMLETKKLGAGENGVRECFLKTP